MLYIYILKKKKKIQNSFFFFFFQIWKGYRAYTKKHILTFNIFDIVNVMSISVNIYYFFQLIYMFR